MSTDESHLEKLGNYYKEHPVISALLQLVPYGAGGALDVLLLAKIDKMQADRQRAFFEELGKGSQYLTEELIAEEDFLHQFVMTLRAAVRTREKRKIQLFARLLGNAARDYRLDEVRYEEFLSILSDLSLRELDVLLTLERFEQTHPPQLIEKEGAEPTLENDLQRTSRFWEEFVQTIEADTGILSEQIRGYLSRLARTGLYEVFSGSFWSYTGGKGQLTELYYEFTNWIRAFDEELSDEEPPSP